MNKEKEQRLKDMWNTIKHTNKNIVGIPKEESLKRDKEYLNIMVNHFPNLMNKINLHMQEAL